MTFYGPKEVCSKLNIAESTLRKWAIYLSKVAGYTFAVDQYGHRNYSDGDILVLKRMQELLAKKYTYEDAVNEVCNVKNVNHANNAENPDEISVIPITHATGVPSVLSEELYKEMVTAFHEQSKLNQNLVERLERLEERAEKRDQALTQVLRQVLEVRAEAATEQEKKKKSWWPWSK